jgi:hypothetical protein
MTVHKEGWQYGWGVMRGVVLADTPRTWPDGPSMSTLKVLLVFAGIPLLVIVVVSILVLAPGWVKGPRYRPGQPWDARREWFGPGAADPGDEVAPAGSDETAGGSGVPAREPGTRDDQSPGGASAGW